MNSARTIVDLLVIGGGTAGIVGARTAAELGARAVLVEQARTGGDCLWTGCVPSKTLLSAAEHATPTARSAVDFDAVRTRIAEAIRAIEPEDSPEALEAAGVRVRTGAARFLEPGVAVVGSETMRYRQALIAVGSAPTVPPIPGLDQIEVLTSETIWDVAELPPRMAVIGGGPVGCELGQAFARLGTDVTQLIRSEILPREDRDAAALLRQSLAADGVEVLEHAAVSRVEGDEPVSAGVRTSGAGHQVHLEDGRVVVVDAVLVATGRTPRTDQLGLSVVGVDCDPQGHVKVDQYMRTTNPRIWAAGDVTPHPDFTHLAGVYASTAASNAVLGLRRGITATAPRVTYTSPEIASVGPAGSGGLSDSASREELRTVTIAHAHTDRAITEGRTSGFTRLSIGRGGRILGGTIVGPRAGESLGELTLAVQQKLSTRDLAAVIHAYPTYNDALWNAAVTDARSALDAPLARRALTALRGITRWRRRV